MRERSGISSSHVSYLGCSGAVEEGCRRGPVGQVTKHSQRPEKPCSISACLGDHTGSVLLLPETSSHILPSSYWRGLPSWEQQRSKAGREQSASCVREVGSSTLQYKRVGCRAPLPSRVGTSPCDREHTLRGPRRAGFLLSFLGSWNPQP